MIIVTGAAGFIGSCLVKKLNINGYSDIHIVDDFSNPDKNKNLSNKIIIEQTNRMQFLEWFAKNPDHIDFVLHIGARTDTTEFNKAIFDELNLGYSKSIWEICTQYQVPLIYASSAATYGMGELGYKDDHNIVKRLKPLNPYGESKNAFDNWVLEQESNPPFWAGLKFFNVYGPNEYHKGRMASVIFHAFNQIKRTKEVKLFRSHLPDYKDGKQLRDFVYIQDVLDVIIFLMDNKPQSGLYNLGTGTARTFLDLAKATFNAMDQKEHIEFIDTPSDIRDKYQYYTEADMQKLKATGYTNTFTKLEEGISDYVRNYLSKNGYY